MRRGERIHVEFFTERRVSDNLVGLEEGDVDEMLAEVRQQRVQGRRRERDTVAPAAGERCDAAVGQGQQRHPRQRAVRLFATEFPLVEH